MIDTNRLLLYCLALSGAPTALFAQGPPPGFQEAIVWSGLNSPTAVRFAPDGHVFVAEKGGLLKVFDSPSDVTPTVFADLRTQVYGSWDRGLLGLAIDPAYPANPYVYVLYAYDYLGIEGVCTDSTGNGCVARGRISRLEADVDGGPVMTGPEVVLVEDWCQQFPSHSIGDLHFGPDGALYATGGEGASFTYVDYGQTGNPCGDPVNEGGALRSQDIRTAGDPVTMDGALLRLDPMTGAALTDNPLFGGATTEDDRIIAHGLRNPFRFAVRPGSGELWIGDVGWNTWEEIDVARDPIDALVENFGWPCYEGTPRQGAYDGTNLPICETLYTAGSGAVATPYHSYLHTGGASISGLAFYDGNDFPSQYAGALFFGDFSARWIKVMYLDGNGEPDPSQIDVFRSDIGPVDVQISPDGFLYYADMVTGQIRSIEYFLGNQPPTAIAHADVTNGSAPLLVHFDGSASFDPDAGDTLRFFWDLDADGAFDDSNLIAPEFTYVLGGSYAVKLRVADESAAIDIDQVLISIDNTPPSVSIVTPMAGETWRVGDVLTYQGWGDDAEDGALPPSALDWKFLMLHCDEDHPEDCHEHLIEEVVGQDQGQFVAVDHEVPCYLELRLTGTDSGAATWWDPAWNWRERLSFDNSASGTDLLNFPALVRLDPTRIDYMQAGANGADLRFVSDDGGTPLSHQIESWDPLGTSIVWVRVPAIPAASTTSTIWMYYGNAAASDVQDPVGVWSEGYAGVWHLDASLQDSTDNANHGVNFGSSPTTGYLGSARSFDGHDDYVNCGSGASLDITSALTVESWVLIANDQLDSAMRVLSRKDQFNSPHGYSLEYQPLQNAVTAVAGGTDVGSASGVDLDTVSWHNLTATIEGTTARIYVDGIERTTDSTITPLAAGVQALHIGRRSGGGRFFSGSIDEVRVSDVVRSLDWIRAQHLSMSDAFISFGTAHDRGVLSTTTTLQLYPETAVLQFITRPVGLELVVFDELRVAPFTREAIVNGMTTVSAPSPQFHNGLKFIFRSWSDGGAQTHQIVVSDNPPPLTAVYSAALPRIFR